MANDLEGMRVAILATNGVEQPELTEPRKALDEAGARTTLIAPKTGKIRAMKHDQPGDEFDVDMALDRANPEDFDAVLLPGIRALYGRQRKADRGYLSWPLAPDFRWACRRTHFDQLSHYSR